LPRTGITLMQRGQNEKDFYVLLVSCIGFTIGNL